MELTKWREDKRISVLEVDEELGGMDFGIVDLAWHKVLDILHFEGLKLAVASDLLTESGLAAILNVDVVELGSVVGIALDGHGDQSAVRGFDSGLASVF
jgi:hypothetical protein